MKGILTMTNRLIGALSLFFMLSLIGTKGFGLIGPVRVLPSGNVLLVPCDDIKLSNQQIELYHHPLGIWLVEYRARLKNLRSHDVTRAVGFPAGFDVHNIQESFYCDRFENFKVVCDDQPVDSINFMVKCPNYQQTTGISWSMDDGSGIGYLNTWQLQFQPEQEKWITITFNFVVTKPAPIYDPDNHEQWYLDLLNWVKQDYENRQENDFQLPVNIGSFWAFYPDSMTIRTYLATDWFRIVDKKDRTYQKEWVKRFEYSEPVGIYSPPELPRDTLSVAQLEDMSTTKLILLKDAFFAKYGKKFKNPLIQKYFNAQPWYSETSGFHSWYLSTWDKENIRIIDSYQRKHQ